MAKELSKDEYIKLFEMFCAPTDGDSEEVLMQHPFKQKGYYVATHTSSLIILPCDKEELDFKEQDKPHVFGVLSKLHTCDDMAIDVNKFEQALVAEIIDEEVWTGKDVDCDTCCGEGEVEWEFENYTKDFDCPACDGDGRSERRHKVATGKQIPNPWKMFLAFGEVGFYDKQLRRLIEACRIIGAETITRVAGTFQTGNKFQVGDFSIVVMPCVVSTWDMTEVTEIKNEDITPNVVNA